MKNTQTQQNRKQEVLPPKPKVASGKELTGCNKQLWQSAQATTPGNDL